ncbi:10539_t:CDS:2, partial [Paraglomus brasilianum]
KTTKGKRRNVKSEAEVDDKQISAEMKPKFKAWEHEIIIRDQSSANLPRIQATRYDIELPVVNHVSAETNFSLLTEIPELLAKAYEIIEEKLKEVSKYVSKWLQFQSLWDLGDTTYTNVLATILVNGKRLSS